MIGSDAFVLTQGNLGGTVSAGNDAAALAIGSITGGVSAGRDATLAAFGSINSTVSAGRDIGDIAAVGNIDGTYSAGRNIGQASLATGDPEADASLGNGIFSGGTINATFTAGSGVIDDTYAVGDIGGSFTAGTSIGDLIAGGNITASLSASVIGNLVPNDPEMQNWTAPSAPISATSQILAQLAIAQSAVTQSVNEHVTSATQTLAGIQSDIAGAQTDTTNALNAALANLTASTTQLRTDSTNSYAIIVAEENDAYSDAIDQAFAEWSELQDAVENVATDVTNANSAAVNASSAALDQVDDMFADIASDMAIADAAIADEKNQASIQNALEISAHADDWHNAALQADLQQFNTQPFRPAPSGTVGQPGTAEGLFPFWGSGRAAIDHFQNGRWVWGSVFAVMVATDVTPAKAILTGGVKLIGAAAAKVMAQRRATGLAGELAVQALGYAKNTTQIFIAGSKASYRIPDVLDLVNHIIGEVKNVKVLSYTSQLRDYVAYAKREGYRFILWVRKDTELSGPLLDAIESGDIIRRYIP